MFIIENYLNEIITYILSYFLQSVQKDLSLQKKLDLDIEKDNDKLDFYKNAEAYDNFGKELYFR